MHKRDWVHLANCHGHGLQLVVSDIIKTIKIMRGSLDAAFELTKVIKCSTFLRSKVKIGKGLPAGWGKTMQQETFVTQYYVLTVRVPEGHCHKAF